MKGRKRLARAMEVSGQTKGKAGRSPWRFLARQKERLAEAMEASGLTKGEAGSRLCRRAGKGGIIFIWLNA